MSIRKQIILWIIVPVVLIGFFSSYFYYEAQTEEELGRLRALGEMTGYIIEQSLGHSMLLKDDAEIDRVIRDLKEVPELKSLLLLNKEGVIRAGADVRAGRKLSYAESQCTGCHRGQKSLLQKESGTLRVVQPVRNKSACHGCHTSSDKYNGVFIIDFSLNEMNRHLISGLVKGALSIIISLILLGMVIFLIIRKIVTGRLDVLATYMQRFKKEFGVRVPVEGDDEITGLQKDFNAMAEAIDDTQRRLVAEQEFSNKLIDGLPGTFCLFSDSGRMIRWNRNFEEITGYSHEEIRAKGPLDFIAEGDRRGFTEKIREIIAKGESAGEADILLKDGTGIPYLFTGIRHEISGEVHILEIGIDISGIRKAEAALRRNSDTHVVISSLLRLSLGNYSLGETLQEALGIILSVKWLTIEPTGAIYLVEDDSGDLVRETSKTLPRGGHSPCDRISQGTCLCGQAALAQEVQFADGVDERHTIRYEGIVGHGHYCVPILFLGRTLGVLTTYLSEHHQRREEEEEFLKAIANVLAGIIHRKKLEKEREKLVEDLQVTLNMVSSSRKMWQDTFDNITDLVFIHDRDCRIIRANRAFSDYCGFRPQEVLNRIWYEIFTGAEAAVTACSYNSVLETGTPVSTELRLTGSNRVYNLSASPYYADSREIIGAVCIARDITEEKEREMSLIMSERLASLGQMASGIAHEINNPLASISGCAEGLMDSVSRQQYDPVLFDRYLRIITEEIARCKKITTSMLSFVRRAAPEKKPLNMNESLSRALELIGLQGRLEKVVVIRRFQEDLPPVLGNDGELRQVFLSILTNALDAMQDKGTIGVATGIATQGEGWAVFVEISDSGPGIPGENLYRIFDPFFTTKSDKGGTGLGLSIARKIILNHSGEISVGAEEGKGSTFRITLPV